jgi:predicted thioesterase
MTELAGIASLSFVVDDDSTAIALGSGDVPVLGTPKVVALCEAACVAVLEGSIPEGSTTVGTEIAIKHLAPTPIGDTVDVTAALEEVAGRLRHFGVVVTHDGHIVATATHTRVVVDRARFLEGL